MIYEFSRTEALIGKEAMDRLAGSKVLVFGIGGVGSYAVEALARSGVGRMVLVDSAPVDITNINRQIHALAKTVGLAKVQVMMERVKDINPRADVEVHRSWISSDNLGEFLTSDLDYIVDAIDTVASKIELIIRAKEMGIPIISSMGAGNKLDPTQLQIADIYKTSVCPLARVMRRELRKRGVDELTVVYSKEPPITPHNEDLENTPLDSGLYPTRRQLPGSVSFVPSAAGLIMASRVVRDLIKDQAN